MPDYHIYYARAHGGLESSLLVLLREREQPYTADELVETHTLIGTMQAESRGEVFHTMQSEHMPIGMAAHLHGLIAAGETDHTSMSCGDVLVDEHVTAWECASVGWREMIAREPV